MRSSLVQDLKPKIIRFMEDTTIAVGINHVEKHLGAAWSTARRILFEHPRAQLNVENVKVKPSANKGRKEPQLLSWQQYGFSALAEFVAESLEQILIQQNKT